MQVLGTWHDSAVQKQVSPSTILIIMWTNPTCDDKDLGANISGGIRDMRCAMWGGMLELTCVLPSDIFTSTLVTLFCPSVSVTTDTQNNHYRSMDGCWLNFYRIPDSTSSSAMAERSHDACVLHTLVVGHFDAKF